MKPLSDLPGAAHAAILGLGAYRPHRVVANAELVEAIASSDEWIQQRSGIRARRWASFEETIEVMATAAAREAITAAGIDAAQIDCVIVATVSAPRPLPSTAPAVAAALGCPAPAAFDIAAACAGFCHALACARDLIRGGSARHALVIGVERMSDQVDPTDRGTAFIFGDGAGAVVVGPAAESGIGPVVWGSDGTRADLIASDTDWYAAVAEREGRAPTLGMAGSEVFRWAAFAMPAVAREAIAAAGLEIDDIDLFVPHQANLRITDAMAKALKLPESVRRARDIVDQGNTSAASIPLALHRMVADGQAAPGDRALIIGFGAGLSHAAQIVTVPRAPTASLPPEADPAHTP